MSFFVCRLENADAFHEQKLSFPQAVKDNLQHSKVRICCENLLLNAYQKQSKLPLPVWKRKKHAADEHVKKIVGLYEKKVCVMQVANSGTASVCYSTTHWAEQPSAALFRNWPELWDKLPHQGSWDQLADEAGGRQQEDHPGLWAWDWHFEALDRDKG